MANMNFKVSAIISIENLFSQPQELLSLFLEKFQYIFEEKLLKTVQRPLWVIIIQQIVTMPIYGNEALNICHPYMTDILHAIYVNDHIWKCTADFLSLLVWRPF